jgi:hypothetical protein
MSIAYRDEQCGDAADGTQCEQAEGIQRTACTWSREIAWQVLTESTLLVALGGVAVWVFASPDLVSRA